MSEFRVETSGGADHYANVCIVTSLIWDKPYGVAQDRDHRVVIMYGSDGISIATKSDNNSHVRLDDKSIDVIIEILKKAIPLSKDAKADARAHWQAVNSEYLNQQNLSKKWKP